MLRTIVGRQGRISWHAATAATIDGYTLTLESLQLVATVIRRDAFKLTQRPLVFEAPHAKGVWTWPIVTLAIGDNGRLTAQLGPQVLTPVKDVCLDFSSPK